MNFPVLKTERCILKLPTEEEAGDLVNFYTQNKEHLAPWDPLMPDELFTKPYWERKIREAQEEFLNHQTLRFHIFLADSQELIGMANFARMVRGVFQCCGLGYRIGQKHEGKGLMTESLEAAIEYVFNELKFHRIEANYIPSNHRSEKLLRKLRFEREGYAKDYLRIAGRWQDHILNSLTNKDWSEV